MNPRALKVQGNIETHFNVLRVTPGFIFITDECEKFGGRSVTNAAEQVAEALLAEHPGRRIIYRDSCGDWDEICYDPATKHATFRAAHEIAQAEFGSPLP